MRRYILLIIVLCLQLAARGQTSLDELDLSGLPQPTQAKALRYWFDDDAGSVHSFSTINGTHSIDVSSLLDGLHTIHCQIIDSEDEVTAPYSAIFLKLNKMHGGGNVTAERLIYWFDDEETRTSVDMMSGVTTLDASMLLDGLHTIHYMVVCSDGSITSAYSSIFLRMNIDILATTAKGLRYWFDEETNVTFKEIIQGMQIIEASHLMDGLHTIHYQIVDDSGAVTSPVSSVFLKMVEGSMTTTTAQSLRYWFDDETDVKTTSVAGGTQTIDVSNLLAGLHTLHYQLVDSDGQLTSTCSGIFLKMFDNILEAGQNRITQYKYWLNNNTAAIQTVKLDAAVNPFTLIALLPMQQEPIRSTCFHFEQKDGKPMMYAKNDFCIRFCDAAGYWVDDSRQFTDYSVSQEVVHVGELQATQTFPKVAANDVRWYTMQVASGDTTAFKLSQPATVQVFAPSGEEVFKTSGSASVQWSGIHTWENGTYYLAVHDVTGSQSTMKLEYMHMDKYDVVDWDVHRVGNGGCSTITFKGNGFRDLYAVDLVVTPGDTIHSVDVSHDSDAETAVIFDFTDATLGDYNAVFHFTEEDNFIANVVTIEEPVDIELATDVSFPSSFLRGTSTTYTIKITNKGNMTAYAVPVYTWLRTKSQDGISHIEYEGLRLAGVFDNIETDSLSASDIAELKALSTSAGDDHYFLKFWTKDEESLSDSNYVRSNYFFTTIAANETKTLRLTISAKEEVLSYFTVPKDWPSINANEFSANVNVRMKASSWKDKYCCIRDRVECAANIVSDGMSVANMIADLAPGTPVKAVSATAECVAGVISNTISVTGMIMCDDNNIQKNFWEKVQAFLSGISIAETVVTCASAYFPVGKYKQLVKAMAEGNKYTKGIDAFGIGVDAGNCIKAYTETVPNCPPDNDGGGGKSAPQPPIDPNDIYGYLSEAGSKFIADSVARVNYTIEFENDTTFATAAAHTIVIKDTLDSRYFDLAKFMPTDIRIGEHEAFLDEADIVTKNDVTSFVKTIDMRPEINAIAQVDGTFNKSTGIAEWRFQSLDPMTMEPTDDLMQGILPVNYNGTSGIGEVMFEIGVKSDKIDGTEISNRASIVFDYEEAILTPTWTNIVDAVAPSSVIDNSWMVNDSTLRITADGFDERSGVWKYTWYVQAGENAPWWNEGETESPQFDYHIFEGIDYGFCVLATDSAGNVEQKVIERERSFKTYGQDFEDGISPLPTSPEEEENVNGKWYDLSGRRHDEPQENQVNIVGRKKILFRKGDKVKR